MAEDHILNAQDVKPMPFPIPGVPMGGVEAKPLNLNPSFGAPTNLIFIKPGVVIPAHYHKLAAETHYVLEGDFINAGITYGPGSFFTHAIGTVHGPQSSQNGCTLLTVHSPEVDPRDFYLAE